MGACIVSLDMETDSTAAKSIASRRGLGKVRHMAVSYLWLQEQVNKQQLKIHKVPGARNLADLMTKYLSPGRTHELLSAMGLSGESGRHKHAQPPSMSRKCTPLQRNAHWRRERETQTRTAS